MQKNSDYVLRKVWLDLTFFQKIFTYWKTKIFVRIFRTIQIHLYILYTWISILRVYSFTYSRSERAFRISSLNIWISSSKLIFCIWFTIENLSGDFFCSFWTCLAILFLLCSVLKEELGIAVKVRRLGNLLLLGLLACPREGLHDIATWMQRESLDLI